MISDWSDLQTILAIATEGTLTAAARRLGVNQSTMSRRLQAIEQALDAALFRRLEDGRLRPTAAAERLIETARQVEALVGHANTALAASPVPLRLATCEVLSAVFAAPALAGWREHTGEPAELSVYDNLFVLPADEFDVMITPLESAPTDMVGRRVGRLDWDFYASPGYARARPLAADATGFDGHDVIHAAGSLAEVATYRRLGDLGGRSVFRSSSVVAQRDMAATGAGIALLPACIVLPEHGLVRLENRLQPPPAEVWMVARRATAAQPRVRRFLDWAGERFRAAPPALKAG
ncbi:LysR family transcriptional regulator [Ciceribacter ferrooxidans]|nr:LysR family transcriptional regulator [Ciceribacter ferrooxidans]